MNPAACSLCLVLLTAVLGVADASADGLVFEQVLDREELGIGPTGPGALLAQARMARSQFAFYANDTSPPYYTLIDGVPRRVIGIGDPIPGGRAVSSLGPPIFDGRNLVFRGVGDVTSPGVRDFALYWDDGSTLRRIVGDEDPLPGVDEPTRELSPVAVEGDTLVFSANRGIFRWNAGTITVLLPPLSPLPRWGEVLPSGGVEDDPASVVFARTSSGLETTGIYRLRDGVVEPIVLNETPRPDGSGVFGRFGSAVWDTYGSTVYFVSPQREGLYRYRDGEIDRIGPGGSWVSAGRRRAVVGGNGLSAWEEDGVAFPVQGPVVEGTPLGGVISRDAMDIDRFVLSVGALVAVQPELLIDSFLYVARFVADCEDGIDNDGDAWTDAGEDPDCRAPGDNSEVAAVDLLPWRARNEIRPGRRAPLPVALLGGDDFDVEDVDPASIVFGPAEAPPLFDLANPWVAALARHDVDRDGDTDLVIWFDPREAALADSRGRACLNGLHGGEPFETCDALEIVQPEGCRLGFSAGLLLPWLFWRRRRSKLGHVLRWDSIQRR